VDPLTNTRVIEAEWSEADALPFPLGVSALVIDGAGRPTVIEPSVARANVVLADHGVTIRNAPLVPPSAPATGPYRPTLSHGELTFQGPRNDASAASAMQYEVHDARPVIVVNGDGGAWTSQSDLLGSDAFSRDFVVEVQTDGVAHLRFGDGIAGRTPAPGASFTASYRLGSGTRGNVGAEAIGGIVWPGRGISRVRNPIEATGGRDPEALEQVRQFAPQAFRTQERAVTESDYAAMAERNPEVQHAAANFRWTGSWYTAFVTVDRQGGGVVDPAFTSAIAQQLERYRMAGYDVAVRSPVFVSLDLALTVCVKPGYFRSDVRQALLAVFGSQDLADGTRGFFHPDNFTFGQSLYLSQIYRAAMQVDGVASVDVTRFQRWGKESNHELAKGVLTSAALEILQLASDPSFPENGRLALTVAGGL
jgi:predicted phage baseplate assembly protein